MAKLAFLYPGQGSQRVAMAAELYRQAPALFQRYLGPAEEVSGLPIRYYCLEATIEQLTRTEVTQPAVFALSLALTEHALAVGLRPDLMAGHSLGEYTAAVAAGALSYEDGLRLVCESGRLMARLQMEQPGAMAVVKGLAAEEVADLCVAAAMPGQVGVAIVNAPGQIVVSGHRAGVERLVALAQASGAEDAQVLLVGVAAHSLLVQPVREALAAMADTITWRDPHTPVLGNVSGRVLSSAREVSCALLDQVTQPLQWLAGMRRLHAAGWKRFLELGSGRVLSGLVRHVAPEAETYASASPRRISAYAQEHLAHAASTPSRCFTHVG